jgi:putative PEP-CTERM system histidine kinase
MYQILRESLYTDTILIWLGDIQKGFRLVNTPGDHTRKNDEIIPGDDPLVGYLHNAPYLYSREKDADPLRRSILIEREAFLQAHDIVLVVPLILGNQCAGLIGLGPETTGGRYGHDDFDLLAALSSHAASALLAVQNAEKLARGRELSVWSNLSAFVLHDIKNAATMLDLVRINAPHHMENPVFQQDMLQSIDDALKRMAKVQTRLSALKEEMVPDIRPMELRELLRECRGRFSPKMPDLDIALECPRDFSIRTDPEFIYQIIENLLINAREAAGGETTVRIEVTVDSMIRIDLQDNGPGIQADLLPRALFEPFKTAKPNGSGIGLWQVRQLVDRLGGDIQARNIPEGGACFTLRFPNQPRLRISVAGQRISKNRRHGKANR